MKKPRNRGTPETIPANVSAPIARPAAGADWRKHALSISALWACMLLAYSNSFQAGLASDSASRTLDDPRVHTATAANAGLIFRSDYWHPALGSGLYRPATTFSLLFNYAVLGNGVRPFGYHIVNWMLHAINILLVYLLALRVMKETAPALAIAALWSLHPVLTEAVTNIVGRADMLAGIGVLGGLLCYIQAAKETGRRLWMWRGGAAMATCIGVFSKENTVIVFGAVALYELAFGGAKWRARAATFAAMALPCLIYWFARTRTFAGAPPMHIPFTDNPLAGADFFTARWTAIKVIGKEMLLLLWPATLSSDYSYNQIPLSSWSDLRAWAALLVCLATAAVAVLGYRSNRPLFFWIGFFFLSLAPTSNLAVTIGTPMAERLLYLPAVGFVGCAVTAVCSAFRRAPPWVFQAVVAVACLALAARTYARNFDWKDENALRTSAVAASPASYKTHLVLPVRNLDDALRELDAAIVIVKDLPDEINTPIPFLHGGQRYREKGDYRKSLDLLLRAERIQSAHHQRVRREQELVGGARFGVDWSPVYLELGRTYLRLGEFGKAADAIRTSLKAKFSPEDFEQLSVVYFKSGDQRQAAVALLEGLIAEPRNGKIASEVVSLYAQSLPKSCAVHSVNGSPSLNLECPLVQEHLCAASANVAGMHREAGRIAAARQTASSAMASFRCSSQLFGQ